MANVECDLQSIECTKPFRIYGNCNFEGESLFCLRTLEARARAAFSTETKLQCASRKLWRRTYLTLRNTTSDQSAFICVLDEHAIKRFIRCTQFSLLTSQKQKMWIPKNQQFQYRKRTKISSSYFVLTDFCIDVNLHCTRFIRFMYL